LYVSQNLRGAFIGGFDHAIVHPFTFAPSANDPCSSQIGQVPGNLGLGRFQDFHEIADTHLIAADQVQQSETSPIGESAEQQFHVERLIHFS
jgi:hypothetical protein